MNDIAPLTELGWSRHWQELFAPHAVADLVAGRVIRGDRTSSLVATADGIVRAGTAARLLKAGEGHAALPVVGDWVALSVPDGDGASLIEAVLARRNAIVRSDAGRTSEVQALAANVDTVFVVHPIADEPNLRRLERELSVAWSSGAVPVVVLTKSDLSMDAEAACDAVGEVAIGVEIVPVNGLDGVGVAGLMAHVAAGRTAILLGPSGAGKSTLINALLGEKRLATGDVRENDGRGRHTTVARELVAIPGHGVIIDTPGLRAIGLTGDEDGIALAFRTSRRWRRCAASATAGTARNRTARCARRWRRARSTRSAWPAGTSSSASSRWPRPRPMCGRGPRRIAGRRSWGGCKRIFRKGRGRPERTCVASGARP